MTWATVRQQQAQQGGLQHLGEMQSRGAAAVRDVPQQKPKAAILVTFCGPSRRKFKTPSTYMRSKDGHRIGWLQHMSLQTPPQKSMWQMIAHLLSIAGSGGLPLKKSGMTTRTPSSAASWSQISFVRPLSGPKMSWATSSCRHVPDQPNDGPPVQAQAGSSSSSSSSKQEQQQQQHQWQWQ